MPRKHYIGFNHAWDGIKYAFKSQKNFHYHLFLGISALLAAKFMQVGEIQLWVLFLLFIFGLTIEMFNTAIESVVDLVTEEWRENAKRAKDVSSGAMLVFATGATIATAIILIPPFLSLLEP